MAALTRSAFESAVKDALRHYNQADLLAGNALLHTRLLTGSGSDATTPQALRTLLADSAKNLFVSERDRRLYRVLELTYLNLAPKQEAVADRLGLSFSTYRRHLTTGVDRMALAAGARDATDRNDCRSLDRARLQRCAGTPL